MPHQEKLASNPYSASSTETNRYISSLTDFPAKDTSQLGAAFAFF
ncbi:hypothetical protein RERY_55540 [Rhodococcus erythropolis]|nr:hypothetical protein RERY_55540 [Rhodococcus erythropolis]